MVIPMGGMGPQIRGPVPDECQQAVRPLKYTVILMLACVVGRIITASYMGILGKDLLNLLNLVLVIVMGTFVLKDDEHFKKIYDSLATSLCSTCHEQGMGGLGCLMPFAVCCGLNFVLDLLFKLSMALDPRAMPYGIFLGGSIVAEGAGAWFGYRMFKVVRDNGLGLSADMEMNSGGLGAMQGGFLGGAGGGARQPGYQPAGQDQSAPAAPQAPAATGFQPFAGSGQRLGS